MSKVELIRRRNNHTARDKEVPDLSKVELFPRRNKSERLIPAKGISSGVGFGLTEQGRPGPKGAGWPSPFVMPVCSPAVVFWRVSGHFSLCLPG